MGEVVKLQSNPSPKGDIQCLEWHHITRSEQDAPSKNAHQEVATALIARYASRAHSQTPHP